jgi:cytochrome b pre-mRNA-processing protein 3
MISLPFRRPRRDPTIGALYGTIVAQARSPAFYRSYGVPDAVSARIDMIMLHLVLVLRRLRAEPVAGRPISQPLFDLFCRDMDDNFREMGVGDLKVPKEMRRIAEAFYGRAKIYDAALDADDRAALATALERNVYGEPQPLGAQRLAAYMCEAMRQLANQQSEAFGRGEVRFPDPDTIAPATTACGQEP